MTNNYKNDWNAYWQSGLTTSCLSKSKDEYPLAIKSFWIEQVLPHFTNKTNLLDLCSGAAGVPKLLINSQSVENKTKLICTSTDYTDIERKNELISGNTITYLRNCNCEALPFEDNSFDCVTSSFGIEYSNLDKTLEEIQRVLKTSGIFAAVIHTENSAIVSNSQQQIRQADYLLNEINYFELFRNNFLTKRLSKAFQKKAELQFKQALEKVKLQIILSQNTHVFKKLLEASETIFQYSSNQSVSAIIRLINTQEKALIQNQNRMRNLITIVNDNNTLKKIEHYFMQKGYQFKFNSEFINNKQCVGHGLIVKKC